MGNKESNEGNQTAEIHISVRGEKRKWVRSLRYKYFATWPWHYRLFLLAICQMYGYLFHADTIFSKSPMTKCLSFFMGVVSFMLEPELV